MISIQLSKFFAKRCCSRRLPPFGHFRPGLFDGSYDGPGGRLRLAAGRCDVPYFIQPPKPIPVKPSTCSLARYDGMDLAIRREDGVCNPEFPIFLLDLPTPRHTRDAQACATLVRVPGSLPSDPHQVADHLSDRLCYLGCLFRVLSNTICSDLDWPVMYALLDLFPSLSLLQSVPWSPISGSSSTRRKHSNTLLTCSVTKYSLILAQALLETARQTSGLVITL